MIEPTIRLFDLDGRLIWEGRRPARVEILARFGAEEASALVAFHPRASLPEVALGDPMEIRFNGIRKFVGKVSELRRDSSGFPLSLQGARRPRRLYRHEVRGLFENQTPTEMLSTVLAPISGPKPSYSGLPGSTRVLDRLDFQGLPLFHAVDLLAKLAGNWLWWIDWEENLHFIPPSDPVEHVWRFDPDRMVLHPWERDRTIKNLFRLHGGVRNGEEFERFFESPESRERFGSVDETLFARPITTEGPFAHLREAVLEEAPWPTDYRAVDRYDGDLTAGFGERFELRGAELPPGLNAGATFRIAAEELVWTEGGMRARYHVAEGLESASRYTRYIDHEPRDENYVAARLGAFTLDLSALDSEAHLDP